MKPGDKVTIYEHPVTETKPEGKAVLVKRIPDLTTNDYELWRVRFEGETEIRERFIRPPRKTSTTQKLWIAVEVYDLIVQGVHAFTTEKAAEEWFKTYTGYKYPTTDWQREKHACSDYDQTKIFEEETP